MKKRKFTSHSASHVASTRHMWRYNVTLTSHSVEAVAIRCSRLSRCIGIWRSHLSLLMADGNRWKPTAIQKFHSNFHSSLHSSLYQNRPKPSYRLGLRHFIKFIAFSICYENCEILHHEDDENENHVSRAQLAPTEEIETASVMCYTNTVIVNLY